MFDRICFFLLFQVPGATKSIPGIPIDFFPKEGMIEVARLHNNMFKSALSLLAIFLFIGFILTYFDVVEISGEEIALSIVLTIVLFAGQEFIFGRIMQIGDYLSKSIFSSQDIEVLNKQFNDAA